MNSFSEKNGSLCSDLPDKKTKTVSVALKLLLFVCSMTGVFLSGAGAGFMGGGTVMLYFTIQSNIWISLTCLVLAILILKGKELGDTAFVIKLVFTVSITLTGFVFCVMLAPTMGKDAWNIQNILTHVVTPVLAIADFFVYDSVYPYKKKQCLWVAVPPLYYVIFAAAGYVLNWNFGGGRNYPYFFLNWGSPAGAFGFSRELPFIGVVWWLVVLIIFLTVTALLYISVAKKIRNKRVR